MHLISATPTSAYDPHAAHLTHLRACRRSARHRVAIWWGIVVGALQVASPLALWWLDPATVLGVSIALIAGVYVGFAVADGRPRVIAVESTVALAFVVLGAAGVAGSAWVLVVAYAAHGLKDLWQHRHDFVRGTRWWPPFCAAVDFVVAAALVAEIAAGVAFHR
jgi:hypothetical protein